MLQGLIDVHTSSGYECCITDVLIIGIRHRFFFSLNFIIKKQENDEKIQKKLLDSFLRGPMRPMTMIIGPQLH